MTTIGTTPGATDPSESTAVAHGGVWVLGGAAALVALASGVARLLGA